VTGPIWLAGRYLDSGTAGAWEPEPEGIFETFVATERGAETLGLHLARLRRSAAELGHLPLPNLPGEREVRELLLRAGLESGRCRLTLLPKRRVAALTVEPVLDLGVRRATPLVLAPVVDGRGASGPPAGHKFVARAALDAARAEAGRRGAHDALLVSGGRVLESTVANVFVADEAGCLVTPPLDGRVLPGVTRARLLARARLVGLPVQERPVEIAEIRLAREVFVTNAVVLVQMVREIIGVFSSEVGDVDRWLRFLAQAH